MNDGTFDAFLWEYFMTKPYTEGERQEVRTIGTVSAPWPSFLVAARADFADAHADAIHRLLRVVGHYTREFTAQREQSARRVSQSFHLSAEDAEKWLAGTTYPADPQVVSRGALQQCVESLVRAKVLKTEATVESLVHASTQLGT